MAAAPAVERLQKSALVMVEQTVREEGVQHVSFTIEPPVVQNCVGPYGNAFHGVRPVLEIVRKNGIETFALDVNWLEAVLSSGAAKLPPIALRLNHHLPLCHLAAYERQSRSQILVDELQARNIVYPAGLNDRESTTRAAIKDSYNWELSEIAWEFVYGNHERWLTELRDFLCCHTCRREKLSVKTMMGASIDFDTGHSTIDVFERLPGANTLYWVVLHLSRWSKYFNRRPLTTMRFCQKGQLLDPRSILLDCQSFPVVQLVDTASSSYFGYLININKWPQITRHFTPALLPWEMLWDDLPSPETLRLISGVNFGMFDADHLHSHRQLDAFLRDIAPLTPEEFHWRARCLSPGAGCVWSPETDKYWPMLFRKIVRYCLQISVAEGVSGVGHLPHEVVAIVASFL